MNNKVDREWEREPNFLTEIDEETGYRYFIVRILSSGHLCGYVEITPDHPLYGKDCTDLDGNVHGGITYSDFRKGEYPQSPEFNAYLKNFHIQKIYLIGFDCSHAEDYRPDTYFSSDDTRTYKNIEFVKNECKKLCKYLKEEEKERKMKERKIPLITSVNINRKVKILGEDAFFLRDKGEDLCDLLFQQSHSTPDIKKILELLTISSEVLKQIHKTTESLISDISEKMKEFEVREEV